MPEAVSPPVRRSPAGRVVTIVGGFAVVLAGAFLLAPALGTDLSAQVARANFVERHGFTPVDFGWYGGVSPYGYSLVSPPLMSWLGDDTRGPVLAGALALVLSSVAFALLLLRTGARRPLLGGLLGAACVAGNLVSGRVTYALGVAFGLLALLALTAPRPWPRRSGALAGAALTAATSPVAGLFVGLAAVALLLGDRRRRLDAALLAVGAAVPMGAMTVLFGAGGWMNISLLDTLRAGTASLAVALLVPHRPVRVGAVLAALGVAAAFAVQTPVGLNATRLAGMFALPVMAAYGVVPALPGVRGGNAPALPGPVGVPVPRRPAGSGVFALRRRLTDGVPALWHRLLAAVPGPRPRVDTPAAGGALAALPRRLGGGGVLAVTLAVLTVWQPPVSLTDLAQAGDPAAERAYFQPLLDELADRPPGRIEVIATANYWDSAYVPEAMPLARGWLRQADLAHNGLFFDGGLNAPAYERWLRDNGVAFVALADVRPSWVGRREAQLIADGLPYLTEVWRGEHWRLFTVAGAPSIVDGGSLVAASGAGLAVDVPAAGEVLVRVRWSRWLRVAGPDGCLAPRGDWTVLRAARPGRYTIDASLTGAGPRCADPR